jgi:hypothetical protein
MSMKNSCDTIGNPTRDLPACSAVPEPTAPPRAPSYCSTLTYLAAHKISKKKKRVKKYNTQ